MNNARTASPTIGCMMIEDFSSGGGVPSGLCSYLEERGISVDVFKWNGGVNVHSRLQYGLFTLRKGHERVGIVAVDEGIDAAIALSVQLPVECMALICRENSGSVAERSARRQMKRLSRFARRNMAFCISDVLLISESEGIGHRRAGFIANGLVNCASMHHLQCRVNDGKIWTDCECTMNNQIYHFLCGEEFTKSLAENSEMCIIYG